MTESDSHADNDLRRAQAGDPEALSRLLARYGPLVRADLQIQSHWRSVIDPDDIMQVSYTEAFLRIGSFAADDEEAFAAWLTALARNNLRDAIRGLEAQKRPDPRRRIQDNDGYVEFAAMLGVTTSTPSRAAARQELKQALDRALQMIPADYAAAVRLLDLEGHPAEEAARRLGRSPGAAIMLAVRGRARLREVLGSGSRFFSGPSD